MPYWHNKGKRQKVKGKSWILFIFIFYLLPFTLQLALPGCASVPGRSELPLRSVTGEQLVELLQERKAAVQSMKGLFSVSIKGPGIPIAQRVEGAVYYRGPDSLRLRGFTRLGGELFDLVLRDGHYRLRLPTMGKMLAGRLSEWERMGTVSRPFKLSVWAVTGAVGITPIANDERVTLVEEGDRYRLEVYADVEPSGSASPSRHIWFERRRLQVVQEDRLTTTGEVEATVEFEDFRPVTHASTGTSVSSGAVGVPDIMLKPFTVTAYDRQGQGSLTMKFHEIVTNPPLKLDELGLGGAGGAMRLRAASPERSREGEWREDPGR